MQRIVFINDEQSTGVVVRRNVQKLHSICLSSFLPFETNCRCCSGNSCHLLRLTAHGKSFQSQKNSIFHHQSCCKNTCTNEKGSKIAILENCQRKSRCEFTCHRSGKCTSCRTNSSLAGPCRPPGHAVTNALRRRRRRRGSSSGHRPQDSRGVCVFFWRKPRSKFLC